MGVAKFTLRPLKPLVEGGDLVPICNRRLGGAHSLHGRFGKEINLLTQ